MTEKIIPIIDQLYWKRTGDEFQLIRQTQESETVFFIATEAEYKAITQAAKESPLYYEVLAAKEQQIAALKDALESLQYYVGNPSAWESYDEDMSERIRKACEVAEPKFWMKES